MISASKMPDHPRRRSRDHICPTSWGGPNRADNIRHVCQDCNSLRAACGHCIGALACARAVAADIGQRPLTIIVRWNLPRLSPSGLGGYWVRIHRAAHLWKNARLAEQVDAKGLNPFVHYGHESSILSPSTTEPFNPGIIGTRVARDLAREVRRNSL